jgi:competence protein ComEA
LSGVFAGFFPALIARPRVVRGPSLPPFNPKEASMTIKHLLLLCLTLLPLSVAAQTLVNLNTADAATLARDLEGIGESKARAIVEHRTRNGAFRSVDELALVKGIGPKTLELNRSRLRVGAAAPQAKGVNATPSPARPAVKSGSSAPAGASRAR